MSHFSDIKITIIPKEDTEHPVELSVNPDTGEHIDIEQGSIDPSAPDIVSIPINCIDDLCRSLHMFQEE